jgi:Uma2 family endonuclease
MGAPLEFTRRALTVEDFHRMGEVGILRPDERVELIEGELRAMAPIGRRHFNLVNRLTRLLSNAVREKAVVSVQNPVVLRPISEPQPDLVLLRPHFWALQDLPGPEDVLLAIEVADTTLSFDRIVKARLYAKHGIAELWIVDAEGQTLLRHLEPTGEAYARVTQHRSPEAVAASLLAAARVDLGALFAC